jgi:hypothetical protein
MGGIAEKRDATIDPSLDRIAITEYPKLPIFAVPNNLPGTRMHMPEAAQHLLVRH